YSHDSSLHQDRVLDFANRLRRDGIDAMLDQYASAPALGWAIWTEQEIQTADFVLLVCTDTYLQRVERREPPGKGRGLVWEGNLVSTLLYQDEAQVQRFIPILFRDGSPSSIPLPLRGLPPSDTDPDSGYEGLYRRLTNQPFTVIPPIGERLSLPPREP